MCYYSISSYLGTQNVEICLAFEKIAGVLVFQLESSFDYRRRLFYYPFFFLLQILLDDFLSSWELKIFKFVNQARLKRELEISLLLMSLLFSDCFDK